MNLSQRVWNLSEQYKTELEMALSAAIEPGTSAMELAADIKTYLNEPDKMFRRFRYKDEEGNWQRKWKQKVTDADGKVHFVDADPKAYHPGRGVYRSSARNAQRLARTEINMAYRKAEQERWKSFDFVVGYEVKITQNGKHVEDICDCLKGKYRKDFKFMGWHPQCMCYTIPILKTEDEFFDDDEDAKSINEVEDVPQGFAKWVEKNADRIEAAEKRGTVPYFIADNQGEIDRIMKSVKVIENSPHYGAAMKLGRSATKEAMKIVENIGTPELSDAQKQNIRELADALGVNHKDIKPMSFLDADQGASNPTKDYENCQSVVVAFEARRRGIDCYALPYSSKSNSASYVLGERFQDAWLNPKTGKVIEPTIFKGNSDDIILSKLKKGCPSDGRYILGINYKDGGGHVMSIEKINGKIILRDEQIDDFYDISSLKNISYLEILRIDKAILNIDKVKSVLGLQF